MINYKLHLNILVQRCCQGNPIDSPVNMLNINPINTSAKKPKKNTQNPTYRAGINPYPIKTIPIMIRVKYFNNFIIIITVSIINSVSYYKISNFFDFFNRKMRVVCKEI